MVIFQEFLDGYDHSESGKMLHERM